ncbi:uncharacterized protein VTP21DRAFT_8323 [Calcarisporiella thermophila]|uniref:uncharacterized protein n=1 Tax=Calcarisporiella thermophila TaxID=911321 RepID=UPI0037440A48
MMANVKTLDPHLTPSKPLSEDLKHLESNFPDNTVCEKNGAESASQALRLQYRRTRAVAAFFLISIALLILLAFYVLATNAHVTEICRCIFDAQAAVESCQCEKRYDLGASEAGHSEKKVAVLLFYLLGSLSLYLFYMIYVLLLA